MIQLRRILAAVDFSEYGSVAIRYAAEFALRFEAALHLLHVVQYPLTLGPEEWSRPFEDYADDLKRSSRRRLEQLDLAPFADRSQAVLDVRLGAPVVEIIRCAREQGIDLIVLGTHGRSGLKHMLMGSVAQNVVRQAPCPVLTVRHPEHEFVMP